MGQSKRHLSKEDKRTRRKGKNPKGKEKNQEGCLRESRDKKKLREKGKINRIKFVRIKKIDAIKEKKWYLLLKFMLPLRTIVGNLGDILFVWIIWEKLWRFLVSTKNKQSLYKRSKILSLHSNPKMKIHLIIISSHQATNKY